MALPYLLILAVLGSFIGGFGTAYKLEHDVVLKLKTGIELSNVQAAMELQTAKEKVTAATNDAKIANINLDKAHESSIQTINAYYDKLGAISLHDPYRKGCANTVSKNTDTDKYPTDARYSAELSNEFTEFLKSETRRADSVTIEKNTLLSFVKNNCGLK